MPVGAVVVFEPVGAARLLLVEAGPAGVPVDVFPAGAPVDPPRSGRWWLFLSVEQMVVVSVYVREGMGYGMKITCGVAPWIEAGCISWIVASPPERKRGRRRGGGGGGDGGARAGAVGRQPVVCTGWCAQVR